MVTARNAVREAGARYKRHQPELTLLYQIVERHYPEFIDYMVTQGKTLPNHIQKEFEAYLKCGRLEQGFIRVPCEDCHHEKLVAFSCKKRGFCHSRSASRMAESAALLVDEILPPVPIRQWFISFPFQLRYFISPSPKSHESGAGHCLSYHCKPLDKESRPNTKNSKNRRRNTHSAFWQCAQPECAFSYVIA